MTKIALTFGGVLVGLFAGAFAGYWVGEVRFHNECGVVKGPLIFMSSIIGIPIGGVVSGLIGYQLGRLTEQAAKRKVAGGPEAKINIAGWNEEGGTLAERDEMVKVRVELTSYVDHDAIRGDLETTGFQETDERSPFERIFSSGSVKRVTGTINAARIEELAALSFVESVEGTG